MDKFFLSFGTLAQHNFLRLFALHCDIFQFWQYPLINILEWILINDFRNSSAIWLRFRCNSRLKSKSHTVRPVWLSGKKGFVLECAYIVGQVVSSTSTLKFIFIVRSMPRQLFKYLIAPRISVLRSLLMFNTVFNLGTNNTWDFESEIVTNHRRGNAQVPKLCWWYSAKYI